MLIQLIALFSIAFSAPLCTIKVETESVKAKASVKTHKFNGLSVRQCKQKARGIDNRPAKVDERFKFVSWEWRKKVSRKR